MTVGTKAEVTVKALSVDVSEYESLAQPIIAQITENLTRQTDRFSAYAAERARSRSQNGASGLADPITAATPPYPYWDMIMYGPFQIPGGGASGPFAPSKVVRAGEQAFMIGVVWRNPAPISWIAGPSAATLTAPLDFQITFPTFNLTTGSAGPALASFAFKPGLPFITAFVVPLTPLSATPPPQGNPYLYEVNMIADVTGPIAGLPFAGYSTWVVAPDFEPPFLALPAVSPSLQHDVPARLLVYTA